ncbi:uncharacterized protein BDZ99DRAFT_465800 [Mytilinidion resinicola]|uniref:Uncharacterized protein n=1 Tax=Mytilinidion resinicola TaxID=574789 RepID=A0A6A6YE37_9PEZI|nr:uncharacterized protein BDZ99DRAFT_465800 [Mytilinidion resinicola]KAF2807076.1 hypothetical protein BDZ99DRAFT_465800 [Mytilinidion resinicola]
MRFSLAITAVLGALPFLAQGIAVPDANPEIEVSDPAGITKRVPFHTTDLTKRGSSHTIDLWNKRATDDDWLMVIYNDGTSKNQCGGTPNNFKGTGSICEGLGGVVGKICADLKVQANVGFAKCDFSFRADGNSCGGKERENVSVKKGHDSNGVKLSDDVRFVSIDCS